MFEQEYIRVFFNVRNELSLQIGSMDEDDDFDLQTISIPTHLLKIVAREIIKADREVSQ